jgi:alkylated DNA nucleotide flippase Atl1
LFGIVRVVSGVLRLLSTSATLDWERVIRTVARNLPETDHNR